MRSHHRAATTGALALALVLAACRDSPGEPEKSGKQLGSVVEEPLHWEVPPEWTLSESSETASRRAGYTIPKSGDDKEDGELLVLRFARGKDSERDTQWDSWFSQFDGDPKKAAKRDE